MTKYQLRIFYHFYKQLKGYYELNVDSGITKPEASRNLDIYFDFLILQEAFGVSETFDKLAHKYNIGSKAVEKIFHLVLERDVKVEKDFFKKFDT